MIIDELKNWKREKGYTYVQLSERSGVPVGTIQKIFNGETENPRRSTILALQDAFLEDTVFNECIGHPNYPGYTSYPGYHNRRPYYTPEDDMIMESALNYPIRHQGEFTVDDYRALPDDQRVELIDGYFYDMAAPSTVHQLIGAEVHRQISNYIFDRSGSCTPLISPVDVQLDNDEKTMVQPDVIIVCKKEQIIARNVIGAPDFVMEVISPGSKRRDCLLKLKKYQNAGVREYWVVDPHQKIVLVYFFESENCTVIYPMSGTIPVNIYNGELEIQFDRIATWVEEIMERDADNNL